MTIDTVIAQCRKVYKKQSGGCCLHIVLDDGNIGFDSVQWCKEYASEKKCRICVKCCDMLAELTEDQRQELYCKLHDIPYTNDVDYSDD